MATDWPAWMPEPPGVNGLPPIRGAQEAWYDGMKDWYERAKAADPALRRVVTSTATGPTPDFEALRPRLDTVFGGDDAEC